MRNKICRTVAALVTCLSVSSVSFQASAQTSEPAEGAVVIISTLSSAELADAFESQQGTNLDTCGAYVLGVADRLALDRKICPTLNAYAVQSIAVAKKELMEKPEQ